MNHAVFLDLDGTLVRAFPEGDTTRGPRTIEEIEILPGTAQAVQRLIDAGLLVILVTNQPDVARGHMTLLEARRVTDHIAQAVGMLPAHSYICPHDGHWCACRKPKAGLVIQAAVERELDLAGCWLVGDRETDREAGLAAGIPREHMIKIQTNQGIEEAVECILRLT